MTHDPYTIEHYPDRPSWLVGRKRGLGASDAAGALGFSRFQSSYGVAADKLTRDVDSSMDETAEWGLRSEPMIADKFWEVMDWGSDQPDMGIADPGDFTIFRSVERPWLSCTPDRLIYKGDKLVAEASIKCAFYDSAKEWKERVPIAYQVQAVHTMYVLGVDLVYYAVLLNGCSFRWHRIRRNETFLAKMLPKLDAFWEAIQRGEYPNVDGSNATAQALARRFPKPGDGVVEIPAELDTLGDEYDALLKQGAEAEKRKAVIQATVKEIIGGNRTAVLMDRSGFTWDANGKGSRTFRRIKKVHDVND